MIFSKHLIVVILLFEVFAVALSPASATAAASMPQLRPTAFSNRAPPSVSPFSAISPLSIGSFAVGPICDLNITKTMSPPSPLVSGSTVTFTFTIADGGTAMCGTPGAANPQTTVTDNLPPELSALPSTVVAPSGWNCSATTTVVSCTTSTWFPVNQPVTITVQATVTQTPGVIENCANVANSADQNSSNNQSCIPISVTPSGSPCDLQLTKSISPNAVASGSTTTVTLTLENVGQTQCGIGIITPIRITDNLPAGMTAAGSATASLSGWDCNSQSTSTTIICYTTTGAAAQVQPTPTALPLMITFPVTVTGTSGSLLTNTATITNNLNNNPYFPDQNQANNQASATVTITGSPPPSQCDLQINKAISPNALQSPGTATVTLTITNVGGANCAAGAAVQTSVTDNLPPGLTANLPVTVNPPTGWTCPLPTANGGTTVQCMTNNIMTYPMTPITISFVVNVNVPGNTVTNCASVANPLDIVNTTNNNSCVTVKANPTSLCDLAINKTMSPSPLVSGQPATITLTVWNNGTATCQGPAPILTTVTETIPQGMTATGTWIATPNPGSPPIWGCTFSGLVGPNTATCTTYAPIPPSTQLSPFVTIIIPVTVTAPPPPTISNCATVANYQDQNPTNNQSCLNTPVIGGGGGGCDLVITKTVSPNPLNVGQTGTVTFVIKNNGTAPCGSDTYPPINVNDTLPSSLTATGPYTAPQGWGCVINSPLIACHSFNVMQPQQSVTITVQVTANGPAGSYVNCANVAGGGDTNTGNNQGCFPFIIHNMPDSATICVLKFNDANSNGVQDAGEMGLSGWVFHITNTNTGTSASVTTDFTGKACTSVPAGVAYQISEVQQSGWTPTQPTSGTTTVTPAVGATINLVFGNKQQKCIIATVAYGSELAPPVQFLRSFRDNQVQKTVLGSTFLTAFNNWYYSWAPGIAQQMSPNENYKAVTRVIIAPLIGSLFVGNAVFSVLAPLSPEMAIVSAGLLASALIGLAYLTPAYALAWKVSKRKITRRTIYCLAIVAAALTFIATLTTGTFNMAPNLTALTVVETLLLVPALVLRTIAARFTKKT